jgi:hypothetical protein
MLPMNYGSIGFCMQMFILNIVLFPRYKALPGNVMPEALPLLGDTRQSLKLTVPRQSLRNEESA